MKKLTFISIILVLILSLWVTTVSAASASVGISKSSITVGDSVTVTVNFGQKVSAAQFTLNYDSSKVTYSSSTGGSYNSSTKKFAFVNPDDQASLSSATFTFKSKSAGSASFSVSGLKISTATQTKFTPSMSNSSVSTTVKEVVKPDPKPDPTPDPKPDPKPEEPTSKDPTFKSTNQKVYAKSEVNVRKSWSTSSTRLGTLSKDDSVTRVGVGSNGWDKITYKGQTGYVLSSYLTTTEPKKDDNKNETKNETTNNETKNEITTNETTNEISNEVVDNSNETVENGQEENKQVSADPANPEKNNANFVLYIVGGVIGLAIIIIIIASVNEKRNMKKEVKIKYNPKK